MASVVRGVFKTIKQKGIGGFRDVRDEGYLQTKIHSIGATLVGVDRFGNKYYEELWDDMEGTGLLSMLRRAVTMHHKCPPEWHGWLHCITDRTGDELLMLKPKRYGVEHKENLSGEGDEYIPLQRPSA